MIGITIAGFDPSGGAGVLADVKTMSSIGIHGTSAITALTCQNSKKFFSIKPVASEYVEEQIDSIFNEYSIEYGKTGLLYSNEIIKAVSKKIKEYNLKIVADPVMISTSGSKLSNNNIVDELKKYLIPNCLITTPNIQEAERLSGINIINEESAIFAAQKIGKRSNVIITGGHFNGTNIIYNKETKETTIIKEKIINTNNLHGSGCTFSAAIASYMIKDSENNNEPDLKIAIKKSFNFVYKSIKNGRYGTLNQY